MNWTRMIELISSLLFRQKIKTKDIPIPASLDAETRCLRSKNIIYLIHKKNSQKLIGWGMRLDDNGGKNKHNINVRGKNNENIDAQSTVKKIIICENQWISIEQII